jgi:ADP-ribose pyrophosphatase YjhB (NUDIX family)
VKHCHIETGYEYWNVPGGGLEPGETEEQAVVREVKEETNMDVRIKRLLIDGPSHRHSPYKRYKTFLCTPVGTDASPDGMETFEVGWFNLWDVSQLSIEIMNNETTYVMLQRISKALAYV